MEAIAVGHIKVARSGLAVYGVAELNVAALASLKTVVTQSIDKRLTALFLCHNDGFAGETLVSPLRTRGVRRLCSV